MKKTKREPRQSRKVVMCPVCFKPKVSLGETFFRCCGEEHKITENMITYETLVERQGQRQALEVSV